MIAGACTLLAAVGLKRRLVAVVFCVLKLVAAAAD